MDTAPRPKISVVVTCYNLGCYLDEALDSVFAQTFQDFDVVIVNDGSTDTATNDLLRDYSRPRTIVVQSEHRGLPGARNLGIRHSAGAYICCLDADDKLESSYFEKAARLLDLNPSLAFASHWLRKFGDEEGDWTPTACDLRSMLTRNTVNGAALVRREAVEAVGGFDERMVFGCEDWDFWLTLLEHGFVGTIIPEVLFFYRRRHDSMSRLMMNGDSHNQLFRFLVEKHQGSYRMHLGDLLLEKDAGIAHLLKESRDLELEYELRLAPALRRVAEELPALEAKCHDVEHEKAALAELARLRSERDDWLLERTAVREKQDALASQSAVVATHLHYLEGESAEIRRSQSWRVTAPLRAIYGWLRRVGGSR